MTNIEQNTRRVAIETAWKDFLEADKVFEEAGKARKKAKKVYYEAIDAAEKICKAAIAAIEAEKTKGEELK